MLEHANTSSEEVLEQLCANTSLEEVLEQLCANTSPEEVLKQLCANTPPQEALERQSSGFKRFQRFQRMNPGFLNNIFGFASTPSPIVRHVTRRAQHRDRMQGRVCDAVKASSSGASLDRAASLTLCHSRSIGSDQCNGEPLRQPLRDLQCMSCFRSDTVIIRDRISQPLQAVGNLQKI